MSGLEETEFSSKNFDKMNQSQAQTIKNIRELQRMERNLYKKLDTSVAGNAVSKSEARRLINRINELSTLRQNLFKNLKNMYSLLRTNVSSSRQNLVNDLTNIGIVESELNNAKKQIEVLQTEKNNKLRMVEINKYYSLNYQNHSDVMKIIIVTCIPIIIVAALSNRGLIPSWLTTLLISICLGAGLIMMFFKVKDLTFRDNMNYDAYNFGTPNNSSSTSSEDRDPFGLEIKDKSWDDSFGCFGQDCCSEGTSWNKDANKCESLNETMISGDLSKYSLNDNVHETVVLPNNSVVVPFSDKNTFARV
tara:strand:- start:388 stop:1305 length:918 start_codon:yes stop_codon:yes gene_type:complete